MPERAAMLQTVQLGVEATPGTPVAANKLISGLTGFTLRPQISVATDRRPMGTKFPVYAIPGTEFVEGSFEGQLAFADIVYFLSAALLGITPPAPNANGAVTWAFTPSRAAEDTPKTFTVEHGSPVRAGRFSYGFIPDLSITINPNENNIAGRFVGKGYTDGLSLTANPTSPELVPVHPGHWKLYIDSTAAGIGTTQLTRAFSAEFAISDHWSPLFVIDSSLAKGFAAHVERVPSAQLRLTLAADAAGMGLLSAIRAGDTRFIRLEAIGGVIGGADTYKLTIDMAAKLSEMGELGDEQDVVALQWTFDAAYDSTLGKAFSITAVNKLAAL